MCSLERVGGRPGPVRDGGHRVRTVLAMSEALPTTTSEITAEWLTEALHGSGTLPSGSTVSAVRIDPQAGGVGFMGEVGKLVLTVGGDPGRVPSEMIAKFATQNPELREMMRPTRVFEREHRFYEVLNDVTPLRTPDVYHVTCNPSDDPAVPEEYLLLMEDLSAMTEGDQVAGVTPERAEVALRGLARHHAHFWGGARLDGLDFVPVINGPLNQAGKAIYEASYPGFREAFAETLQPEMLPVAEQWPEHCIALLDRLAAMPHTLVHFDFRADNLFFDVTPGAPLDDQLAVIDWQAIARGGGAYDVGYFLSQNLSTEDRRAHEDDLLHAYHDALGAGGVTGYDFDQLVADYRVGMMYGWVIPVLAVGSLDFTSERAVQLWTNVIERAQDAIFQHGAHELIVGG